MSGILFDTNVLLDIATADATWLPWSEGQFVPRRRWARFSSIRLFMPNSRPHSPRSLISTGWLDPAQFFGGSRSPYAAGWLAAQAFVECRPQQSGARSFPLPCFCLVGNDRTSW